MVPVDIPRDASHLLNESFASAFTHSTSFRYNLLLETFQMRTTSSHLRFRTRAFRYLNQRPARRLLVHTRLPSGITRIIGKAAAAEGGPFWSSFHCLLVIQLARRFWFCFSALSFLSAGWCWGVKRSKIPLLFLLFDFFYLGWAFEPGASLFRPRPAFFPCFTVCFAHHVMFSSLGPLTAAWQDRKRLYEIRGGAWAILQQSKARDAEDEANEGRELARGAGREMMALDCGLGNKNSFQSMEMGAPSK